MSSENRQKRIEQQIRCIREINLLAETIAMKGEDGVLLVLREQDRPMLSGELVEQTGLTTGRVANILKSLEAKSLIDRRQDSVDKRRVFVKLTEKGREAAEQCYDAIADSHRLLEERFGDEKTEEIYRAFVMLVDCMKDACCE